MHVATVPHVKQLLLLIQNQHQSSPTTNYIKQIMKKFSNPYKTKNTGNQARFFWSGFVQWLRLLVLSFKRKKEQPAGIFLHEPDTTVLNKLNLATITTPPIKNKKLPNMKPAKLLIKWGLMLLLAVCATNAM